jgi:hypothetical protein
MVDVTWWLEEVRYIVQPEHVDFYIFINVSDLLESVHLVPGWHYKKFPAKTPAVEILGNHQMHADCIFWPEKMPPERPYKTRLQGLLELQDKQTDPLLKEALQLTIDAERFTQERQALKEPI